MCGNGAAHPEPIQRRGHAGRRKGIQEQCRRQSPRHRGDPPAQQLEQGGNHNKHSACTGAESQRAIHALPEPGRRYDRGCRKRQPHNNEQNGARNAKNALARLTV